MAKKPHLYFRNPVEGVEKYKQKVRYSGKEEEEEEVKKDYTPMKEDFILSIRNYSLKKTERIERRTIDIPIHISLIEIDFFDFFDASFFENRYREKFGLSPIKYFEFNTKALFAIINEDGFNNFITNLQNFINVPDNSTEINYDTDIKFIKKFFFHSTERIINYTTLQPYVVLSLIENPEVFETIIIPIENRLIDFLNNNNIEYIADLNENRVELVNINQELLNVILDNFDIIQSANSFPAGIIRPTSFNLPERSFGFSISNADAELPIIGIIDTGVDNQTPLNPIIINQGNEFDLTGTSPTEDSSNHGTAVAALASLGKNLYPNHIGTFEADAKILSLKVLNDRNGIILQSNILSYIRNAHSKYGIKIFTLTICYISPKPENSNISDYAYALDLLAYELDILIFISIGNNHDLTRMLGQGIVTVSYPEHFSDPSVNLFIPSDSMNNVTVGAVAGNLENNDLACISPNGEYPAIYTRKYHINWNHPSINKTRKNKHVFKPDVINYGGDYDGLLEKETTGIKTISVQQGVFFSREIGTSYAAPLTANLAAKILNNYPALINSMQSIKALIINSSNQQSYSNTFDIIPIEIQHLSGSGIPDDDNCLFSNDNSATFILEDIIVPGQIKSYQINLPKYLCELNYKRVIDITATLCFKFKPIGNSHLTYCPLHIAFGFFKNLPLQTIDAQGQHTSDGINGNILDNIKLKASWSQDYYYKAKLLSNCQKIKFCLSKEEIIEESGTIKIVVNSKLHKLLNSIQKREYNIDQQFTIAINIKERPYKGKNTGRLYNEIIAINNVQQIIDIEGEATAEASV